MHRSNTLLFEFQHGYRFPINDYLTPTPNYFSSPQAKPHLAATPVASVNRFQGFCSWNNPLDATHILYKEKEPRENQTR